MAGTIVDYIAIAVGLDGSKIGQDAQRVAQQADAAMRPVAEKLSNNFLAPFKGLLAPLIGALGITAAANEYMTAADAVGKLSDSLDIDIEDMQAWSEAAVRAGGSAGAFQSTVSSMTRQIQVAASMGKGPGATMLNELGIAFKDSTGKARDTLEVLRDLAGKAEGMSKQEFAGLAQKLGIDRGTIMLLQSGRQSLDELIARQRSLGVYTKEDAEVAAKANDAMADFQQVIKALSAGLMRVFVPALTFVTEKLTIAVNFVRQHRPAVLAAFSMIAAVLTAKMIPALISMGKAGWAAMRPFLPWIIVLGTAALLVDDFYAYLQGGKSLFADFWSSFGTGEEITKNLTAAWEGFKSAASTVLEYLKPYIPALAKIAFGAAMVFSAFKVFSTVVSFLSPVRIAILLIAAAATYIYENWGPISQWFKDMWEQIRVTFQRFKNWVSDIWNKSFAVVIGVFKAGWDGLVSWATSVWEAIKAPFKAAYDFIAGLFGEDTTSNDWTAGWEGVLKFFTGLWDGITKIFDNGLKAVKKVWDAVMGIFKSATETAKEVGKQAQQANKFLTDNQNVDWNEIAERAANGEDVSAYYHKATPADGVRASTMNAATGKMEQNNNTTVTVGKVEVVTPATDANGIAGAMGGALESKLGDIVHPSETGTVQKGWR